MSTNNNDDVTSRQEQQMTKMSLQETTDDTVVATVPTTVATTTVPIIKKGTAKRDALRANEKKVQQLWDEHKVFEANVIVESSTDITTTTTKTTTTNSTIKNKETFMVTFPYPYSNGHLHIGHAYSLTKAIFRAQYEHHLQKNVLFPFAFHCTGMPIQAVRFFVVCCFIYINMFLLKICFVCL
jgi:tRNA synthetases class I (I, L, M and V)